MDLPEKPYLSIAAITQKLVKILLRSTYKQVHFVSAKLLLHTTQYLVHLYSTNERAALTDIT
jgi:hypothetical protein